MKSDSIHLKRLARRLPKSELHLHIEGTLEPEQMLSFARRNEVKTAYASPEEARAAYNFADLQSFLDIYYGAMRTLVEERDFYDLTMAYVKRAASEGVVHAEIFFDPQAHTSRGVPFDNAVKGIHRALEDANSSLGFTSSLIMCFLRDMSAQSAMETLEQALKYKAWIKSVGMDSKELGNPPRKFLDVYARARAEGFMAVAHAGEEAPPEYVWEALDSLKISRIDHGYHMFEDANLVNKVVAERIPVTFCPLASIGVEYFRSVAEMPVRKALDLGMVACINSDDPAYFKGYIAENLDAVIDAFSLSERDVLQLLRNSFEASFLGQAAKEEYIRKLGEQAAGPVPD
ncbi:MAG TPA: adenosine deaminase [Nitrososphaerales archaeon]|nr:adenosine deaminase [Nitrososphaerales archaeon]